MAPDSEQHQLGSPEQPGEPPPASAQPEPSRRRRVLAASGTVVVAIGVVLGVTLAGGGSAGRGGNQADAGNVIQPPAASPVAHAAAVTAASAGFRESQNITATIGSRAFHSISTGAITEHPTTRAAMTFVSAGQTERAIYITPYAYVHSLTAATAGTSPGAWLRIDLRAFVHALGFGSLSAGSGDPTQYLSFLRAAGGVTRVGRATIRGIETTHYRALADLKRYAAVAPSSQRASASKSAALLQRVSGSSTLPMQAWVDAQGRVRRILIQERLCSSEGAIHESISTDFFDYGAQPKISPPPAGEVQDVTSQVASQEASAVKRLGC